MPWKETSPVEERLRFVAGLLEGEPRRRCAINAAYVARPATRSWYALWPRRRPAYTQRVRLTSVQLTTLDCVLPPACV
jgi:hypothetical protein